jgi:hypothetical protein
MDFFLVECDSATRFRYCGPMTKVQAKIERLIFSADFKTDPEQIKLIKEYIEYRNITLITFILFLCLVAVFP